MENYNKLKKNDLKGLIKKYKQQLESELSEIKKHKLSKLKKKQLVDICNNLFNSNVVASPCVDVKKEVVDICENDV